MHVEYKAKAKTVLDGLRKKRTERADEDENEEAIRRMA
jgi:hypothetical protein